MRTFKVDIQNKIRKSTAPYLPIAIGLFIATAILLYAISQLEVIPRIFLVFPILFPLLAIWLIYQWVLTFNIDKHPLIDLLFESPQDLQSITILKNVFNFRVTFHTHTGKNFHLTVWGQSDLDELENAVIHHIGHDVPINRVG